MSPVTIHETIDGTVRSSKDINYKYPQIFDIEWNQTGEKSELVTLDFTIRKDIEDFTLSYSFDREKYMKVRLEPSRSDAVGISYQWTYEKAIAPIHAEPVLAKRTIYFLIVTNKSDKDLETELTYTVDALNKE